MVHDSCYVNATTQKFKIPENIKSMNFVHDMATLALINITYWFLII